MKTTRVVTEKRPVLLGVIPARSGSRGIRNKHLRKLLKRPLIYYTIKDGLKFKELYKTIVSTDSINIANVARRYKAEVPFIRPKRLAKDRTPMLEVLKHALTKCEEIYSQKIDGIVLFDPTSPVRNGNDIKSMISLFLKKRPDLVVAVAKSRRNPYFNMVKRDKRGYARLALNGHYFRRQDTPPVFDISNNCWIFSRRAILRGSRIPLRTIAYETDSFYIDIDKERDLKTFEWYLRSKARV